MNKKRFLAVLLSLVFCTLSACSLIDNPGEGRNGERKITDDFMVGMFLYVDKYDGVGGDCIAYPTDSFDNENAISLYNATMDGQDLPYSELVSSKNLSGVLAGGMSISETNNHGIIEISTTLVYTYELIGGLLYIKSVYQKNGKYEYYVSDELGIGYMLNVVEELSLSSEQNLSTSYTDTAGSVKELKYDSKWTVNIKFINYLISAKIVEVDKDHEVIKTQNIDFASDEYLKYKAQSDCEYILIEEEYEVKHDNESNKYPIGTKYTERYFFNKSAKSNYHAFNAPVGNGFVKYIRLSLEF